MLMHLRYALFLIWRQKALFFALSAAFIVALGAYIAGSFSPRQPGTVALDVGLSLMRFLLPLTGLLSLQAVVAQDIDRRHILLGLTFPFARWQYLLGRWCGVLLAQGLTLLLIAAALWLVAYQQNQTYTQATPVNLGGKLALVLLLQYVELATILALGLLVATLARTPNMVLLVGLAFTVGSRSIGSIVELLQADPNLLKNSQALNQFLTAINYVVPDLAVLDIRAVALYNRWDVLPGHLPWAIGVALLYSLILLSLSVLHFNWRAFD